MARILVTGATGFVGSHVAERLKGQGHHVVTVARPSSDTRFLDQLGVELVRGDLNDPAIVSRAMKDVDAVVNCAAKVGDWGPVEDYRQVNVASLALLLEEARKRKPWFVHLSSLGVYEARDHDQTDESVPPPAQHMDGYTQTKVEAENLALGYHKLHGIQVVILRPGFVYGPRDRTVLPRLMENLRAGYVRYLGSKDKAMNAIYVGNLVDAVELALRTPAAAGQIYNLTDDELITKQRFMETIAEFAGLPKPTKTVPLGVAKFLAATMEGIAKLRGAKEAPRLTRARVKFLGLNLSFSCAKAKKELGYKPSTNFAEGMRKTIDWWKAEGATSGSRA